MAGTYGDLQTRIADELSRTDLTSQIQLAIQSAIKFYERDRFYFNESNGITFNTVAGQEEYTSTDNSDIPNLQNIDDVRITISSGNVYTLKHKTWDYLEDTSMSSNQDRGLPTSFAYYSRKMRLYPIPDNIYAIRITAVKALPVLSATTDANDWMTEGEDLIRSRAKWELYTHVIRDFDMAKACADSEAISLQKLRGATAVRGSSGYVSATDF